MFQNLLYSDNMSEVLGPQEIPQSTFETHGVPRRIFADAKHALALGKPDEAISLLAEAGLYEGASTSSDFLLTSRIADIMSGQLDTKIDTLPTDSFSQEEELNQLIQYATQIALNDDKLRHILSLKKRARSIKNVARYLSSFEGSNETEAIAQSAAHHLSNFEQDESSYFIACELAKLTGAESPHQTIRRRLADRVLDYLTNNPPAK